MLTDYLLVFMQCFLFVWSEADMGLYIKGNNSDIPPPPPPPGSRCEPDEENNCACKLGDGTGVIDLSSLAGSGNTPRFKDVKQEGGVGENSFSFSPCNGFDEGDCSNAAMCITTSNTEFQQIGDAGRVYFLYNQEERETVAAYTHRSVSYLSVSEVVLKCDENACEPNFVPQGQSDRHYYKFTLTTVCACPNGCSPTGPVNCKTSGGVGGVSVGTVLLIVFVCCGTLYLASGVTYMRIKHKALGTDAIPHRTFWASTFVLIKGGVRFTLSKAMPSRFTYESV